MKDTNTVSAYNDSKVKYVTKTGMMAALIFIATYAIKIPAPNGYTHLGDCLIFIAVLTLGTKRGALAAGIGAALSDMMSGFLIWVVPSFIIKAIMALIMGAFTYRLLPKRRFGWAVGAVIGGIVQIVLYTVVKIPLFGPAYAVERLPVLTLQTLFGIIIAAAIISVLNGSHIMDKLREV